ncbi:response regulator [Spirabiliibacterium falconis]|uniref:response regulator n=1 Tax=Spirabiliibacterium falconis TaxID=572023 RepID=UPI001AADC560|nr:response regulator [Spirabiliibacterium falconis]MBE2894354.1 response regulator transcription factor [Spirabiliibacterium falconis]
MKLYLVDDDHDVLDAATFLLNQAGYQVQCWTDSQQFLAEAELYSPGIVILDMYMPYYDGKQVHQYLIEHNSPLAVIILTAHADIPMAVSELKKGAIDFLQKPISFEALEKAIHHAQAKTQQDYVKYRLKRKYNTLSEKEKAILKLVVHGKINRQIAELCNISIRTVEVHRANIYKKMESKNLAELIANVNDIQNI